MTLKVRIQLPKNGGPYEAKVCIGVVEHILEPGDEVEGYVFASQDITVSEMPVGSKAASKPN